MNQKYKLPKVQITEAVVAQHRAYISGTRRSEGAKAPSWFKMIFLMKKAKGVKSTRSSDSESYRNLKFRALRAALLFGSWSFDLLTFPRRFFFSNRSVNTM